MSDVLDKCLELEKQYDANNQKVIELVDQLNTELETIESKYAPLIEPLEKEGTRIWNELIETSKDLSDDDLEIIFPFPVEATDVLEGNKDNLN